MSPFKRTERAKAKSRAGRHRRPEPEPLRGGPYPLTRTPVAQVLLNPHAPAAEVPVELTERDYEFPPVHLPDFRPVVTAEMLRGVLDLDDEGNQALLAALEGDDTQPIQPVRDEPTPPFRIADRVRVNALPESGRSSWNGRTGVVWFITPYIPVPIDVLIDGTNFKVSFEAVDLVLVAAAHDDTQTLDMSTVLDGDVVDQTPQPAQHEGLAPVPVPSLQFLNAAAPQPQPEPSAPWLHVGNALPAALTSVELMLLDRPIPDDAPRAARPPAPGVPAPVRRDARHPLVFAAFDDEFWELVNDTARQQQAGPGGLRMSTDAAMAALDEHLDRVEQAHRAWDALVPWLYAGRLADDSRSLPRRTPGASLVAIEASRGELVAS